MNFNIQPWNNLPKQEEVNINEGFVYLITDNANGKRFRLYSK